ncbi:family 20 glycosylhydrolase [Asticcacaulis sp. EMRT-3]|uniref:family 20 glycosylhydrolase n=1 Tax=Asticcacaulis sp. EMRT-3 TaxID=3040349 RepID=UPI0024AF33CA|nr:family 20 glycosylhydrolase [Asticcacaulis sp. EMRT-3]MDI7775571.1 family 20 glycosylhydrolase [Asticcacaulis sp. EMRT-3]
MITIGNATKLAGLALLILMPASSSVAAPAQGQAALDAFADHLGYRYTILDNHAGPAEFASEIDLTLPATLPPSGWSLYFGMVNAIHAAGTDTGPFDLTHINGDLYRLTPKPDAVLQPGQTYALKLMAEGHFYSRFHAMPNAYIAADGLKARIIAATKPVYDPATDMENLPFVAPMTDAARLETAIAGDETRWLTPQRAFAENVAHEAAASAPDVIILPTPLAAKHLPGARLDLRRGIHLNLKGLERADIAAALADLPFRESAKGLPVSISVTGEGAPESYHMLAQNGRIAITAADSAGAFYALESLGEQAAYEHDRLRPLDITDAPRFGFRGLHLDLARNFESKAQILKIIDEMGRDKLNKLHLHLGDDEGWRLVIPGLPELTDIGGQRCNDMAENHCLLPELGAGPTGKPNSDGGVNGYLTRADYIDILRYAKARHIEVIPSFDMPGHSRAAIRAMEARYRRLIAAGQPEAAAEYRLIDPADTTVYDSVQHYDDNTLNICLPSTYHFIDHVIDAIKAMYEEAGAPLRIYHIGTDETAGAWKDSPACQTLMQEEGVDLKQLGNRFIVKVSQILASKGIEPAGWSDGMGSVDPAQMPARVQSNSWGGLFSGGVADAQRQANQGWDVVMSTPEVLYFDMPYAPDPEERGYDWASRGTSLYKVFSFLPANLPANASVMKNGLDQPATIADTTPLTDGHKIAGMQGQLWSETVRSNAIADYMLFPRTLALAERAWHRADWEPDYKPGTSYSYGDGQVSQAALDADWQSFNAKLTPHLAELDRAGIIYRLPPPGARITGGVLEANIAYGDLAIEYRVNNGPWQTYRGAVAVSGPVALRSVSPDGKRYSRTVSVP